MNEAAIDDNEIKDNFTLNIVSGHFTFDRVNKLNFTLYASNDDYELVKLTLLALLNEVTRQLNDEARCPFYSVRESGKD
jgi:uncharacterized protein YtpQ (UPF0354 family)